MVQRDSRALGCRLKDLREELQKIIRQRVKVHLSWDEVDLLPFEAAVFLESALDHVVLVSPVLPASLAAPIVLPERVLRACRRHQRHHESGFIRNAQGFQFAIRCNGRVLAGVKL